MSGRNQPPIKNLFQETTTARFNHLIKHPIVGYSAIWISIKERIRNIQHTSLQFYSYTYYLNFNRIQYPILTRNPSVAWQKYQQNSQKFVKCCFLMKLSWSCFFHFLNKEKKGNIGLQESCRIFSQFSWWSSIFFFHILTFSRFGDDFFFRVFNIHSMTNSFSHLRMGKYSLKNFHFS